MSDLIDRQADLSGYVDQLWKYTYERCKIDVTDGIAHCKDCAYFSEHEDYYMCGTNVLAYAKRRTDEGSD